MTKRQPHRLAELLERVRNATSEKGMKKVLAEELGTSPQILNDWLSGRFSPGGEVTLHMKEWVTEWEKQPNKKRGSAQTPPRRKTRKLNSKYETSKQARKGK